MLLIVDQPEVLTVVFDSIYYIKNKVAFPINSSFSQVWSCMCYVTMRLTVEYIKNKYIYI